MPGRIMMSASLSRRDLFRGAAGVGVCSLAVAAPARAAKPNAKPLAALRPGNVILFQGDSITEGGRWPGNDFNHIMGQGYAYIIAAQVGAQLPERHLTFINRGVSGNTVVNLAARWQGDTIDLKPDILSLMVGVNDTFYSQGESVDTYAETYDRLISDTLAVLPGIRIILGESFLLPVGNYKADYALKLAELRKRQVVVAQLAVKYHLPLVRYQAAFDAASARTTADDWSWDGVHPTYAGHALMAQAWLSTVDTALAR